MIELTNEVNSRDFIWITKALGMATKFTSTELDYIYHGFDNMGIDPRLLFNYDRNVQVLNISDIFNDLRHDQLVDICEDLLPSEYMDEDDYEEPDNLDDGVLCGCISECEPYAVVEVLNSYLNSGFYMIHPDENKLFFFMGSPDD